MTNPETNPERPADPPTPPTPGDPHEQEPVRDPPTYPERDDEEGEVRQGGGVKAPQSSPDAVVYDVNTK
jgi:hypothetical protein